MRSILVALLMLAVTLAGCTDGGDPTEDDDAPTGTAPGTGDGDADDDEPLPLLNEPMQQEWFFTAGEGLSLENQTAGSFTAAGGYSAFASPAPTTLTSEPMEVPTLVLPEEIEITLFLTSDVPATTDPEFGYIVWVGSTQSVPLSQFVPGGETFVPGETQEIMITQSWGDRLPILVEPGESLQILLLVNASPSSDSGSFDIMVGGDTASSAVITTQTYNQDPLDVEADEVTETFTGTLHASHPIDCDVQEDVSHVFHDVVVGDNVSYLRAESSGSDASSGGDLDIDLYDGSTVLGGGHTPSADEGILFARPALDELHGKTLQLRVGICFAQEMQYSVDVTQA